MLKAYIFADKDVKNAFFHNAFGTYGTLRTKPDVQITIVRLLRSTT